MDVVIGWCLANAEAISVVLAFLSGFFVSALLMLNKIVYWRIKCIELEHDLARIECRIPRSIDTLS